MKKKEHLVEIDSTTSTLYIDGVPYVSHKVVRNKIDGVNHLKKVVYKKATKKDIDKGIEKIVQSIKQNVTKEELLREIINSKMGMMNITRIGKQIDKGQKPKKHQGCLGFKIGNKYLSLVD
jgi:hypothetical protein|tara:strand:- start:5845 stop:6207 length:363 start_codon:yes stop_codon:yes gene_type:complete